MPHSLGRGRWERQFTRRKGAGLPRAGRAGRGQQPRDAGRVVPRAGQGSGAGRSGPQALAGRSMAAGSGPRRGRRRGPRCVWAGSRGSRWGRRGTGSCTRCRGRQQPQPHGEAREGQVVPGAQGGLDGREAQLAAEEQAVRGGRAEDVDGEGALPDAEAEVSEDRPAPHQPSGADGQVRSRSTLLEVLQSPNIRPWKEAQTLVLASPRGRPGAPPQEAGVIPGGQPQPGGPPPVAPGGCPALLASAGDSVVRCARHGARR